MQKIFMMMFMSLVWISVYSCRDKKDPEPVVMVDSTLLKPSIKFDYQLLDSGGVKFTVRSADVDSLKWWTTWYRSKAANPTFYFEKNARYKFLLQFTTKKGRSGDTTFVIDITNAPGIIKADSFSLKGLIFDRPFENTDIGHNDFYGVGLASLPLGTPSARFVKGGISLTIADFNTTQGKTYESMKNHFEPGKKALAQLKRYPTTDYSRNRDGWYFLFASAGDNYASGNAGTDSLEILEVEEFRSRKLFPEMEERGFWVTWRIRATTDKGAIDCVLKARYIIYETYIIF